MLLETPFPMLCMEASCKILDPIYSHQSFSPWSAWQLAIRFWILYTAIRQADSEFPKISGAELGKMVFGEGQPQ